jgi:predicted TIM-barrel fold metal-dependent hydrolase
MTDVDLRLKMMDDTGIDLSILIPFPNLESAPNVYNDDTKALTAAQFINNAIAKIVNDHPDRFLGVATLPTHNVNDMLGEFERAVKQLNAVGGWFPVSPTMKPPDHPDYMKLYAKAVQLDVPLWIHPMRPAIYPDYIGEPISKYYLWLILGWLHDSSIAMSRIVFANVFRDYPKLKIIIHHHGAHIPLWAPRMQGAVYDLYDSPNIPTGVPADISKPYIEHFKKFYVDTVCMGPETAVLKIAYDFFGPDHILFGTDAPFSVNNGKDIALASRRSVEKLDVTNKELENIFSNNVLKIIPH